jgi:N-acetylmuramoyl-L-alanine amidase
MRDISWIVIHCTATDQDAKVSSIMRYWQDELGWKNPGYHYIFDKNGHMTQLQDESKPTNGVRGYNANSIHVCYIGGKDKDDRTPMQKAMMLDLIKGLRRKYPNAIIQGHRDFPNVAKACPQFDAKKEFDF